jgi:hypothetical protein
LSVAPGGADRQDGERNHDGLIDHHQDLDSVKPLLRMLRPRSGALARVRASRC